MDNWKSSPVVGWVISRDKTIFVVSDSNRMFWQNNTGEFRSIMQSISLFATGDERWSQYSLFCHVRSTDRGASIYRKQSRSELRSHFLRSSLFVSSGNVNYSEWLGERSVRVLTNDGLSSARHRHPIHDNTTVNVFSSPRLTEGGFLTFYRVHYHIKKALAKEKRLEFFWQQTWGSINDRCTVIWSFLSLPWE